MRLSITNTVAAILLLMLTSSANVTASPIKYTLTGTGSGSLAGNSFASTPFTFVLAADIDDAGTFPGQPDLKAIAASAASIDLAGLGLFTFGEVLTLFVVEGGGGVANLGMGVNFGRDVYDSNFIAPFVGYDFTTEISVPDVPYALFQWSGGVATSGGQLIFDDNFTGTGGTFTASLVPLPAAFWLFGSALGFLGRMRRKAA